MPEVEQLDSGSLDGPNAPASQTLGAQIDIVTNFLRRRYLTIIICVLMGLAAGAVFLYTASPIYTASATMLLEARKSPFADSLLAGTPTTEGVWIESQMMVLRSQPVAAYVVKQLRLAEDPQFLNSQEGAFERLFDRVLARVGWGDPEPQTDAERFGAAVQALLTGLDVKRIGPSYVVQINFRSPNAEQATKIANAIIDGYIFDQLNAKYQANRRAGDWLQERLQALREQAAAAERAVLEYKAKHNIVSAGGGALMNEKQLGEMSGALAGARARTADMQARLDRVQAVRQAYQQDQPSASATDETVSEAMTNGIIGKLQAQYLDLKNREADWSARYGKNHTAVVNIRNQIRDIRRSIRDELGRIAETFHSELEIAKTRQDELEKGLANLISQSGETNQAQVVLFSLEAAAQSYRKLYDNFLQRQTESVQQQSWPISDARPVSPAFAKKTFPRPLMAWPVAIFAGLMLGVGISGLREIRDRGFRTREQVRSVLGVECLALVPLLTLRRRRQFLIKSRRTGDFTGWQALPAPPSNGLRHVRRWRCRAEVHRLGPKNNARHFGSTVIALRRGHSRNKADP